MSMCQCIGYEGCVHEPRKCGNPGGGYRSSYFCAECDPRRIAYLTEQLGVIATEFKAAQLTHRLEYRCASSGLVSVGIPNVAIPHWYCTCGKWRIDRDLQGHPLREAAERRHRQHVAEVGGV